MKRGTVRRGRLRGAQPSACAAALLAVATSGLVGQETRPDTVSRDTVTYEMAELTVRATRPVTTTSGASAVRLELEAARLAPLPLLEDALRAMPFVQVKENSRGEAQLTLRGTESRQVAVLVDGVPLTLGWDARTDLSLIPTDAAREIQLFRGISSVLHGPNVLGGVVEIDLGAGEGQTLRPSSAIQGGVDETGATVAGGRIGTRTSIGDGALMLQFGGSHRQRNAVPLPAGVAQPAPAEPGERLNSDLEHLSGFFTARYEAAGGAWASLSSMAYSANRGVPPELHVREPRLWRVPEAQRIVTALTAGTAWGSTPFGEGDVEASIGIDYGDQEIEAYESLDYRSVVEREFADDRTVTLRALGDHTLGAGILRGAFTWAETRHIERFEPGETSRFRQRLFSLGAELEHPVSGPRAGFWSGVRLSAGASYDHAGTPETGGREPREPIGAWGARVGGSALLGAWGRLHMGASRRVRFPSLRELYSGALGRFVPNPDLQPEVLRTLEVGVTGEALALGGEAEVQGVLFHQRFSDAIVRTGLADGRFMRQNRNRVRAAGIELLGSIRWSGVLFGADVTWQDVKLTDEEAPDRQRRAEYQPEFSGSVDLSAPLVAGIAGRAELEVVGRQFCVDPELGTDVALDASGRLDLLLTREWRIGGPFARLQTTVAVGNLTDAAVFDQCGLPQPGRTFRLQFRLF